MYDVIVVGARCGGAPTAMLLARQGLRVLLVDRVTFPRDIPHGHFIHRHGPRLLHRWGLLERIVATGSPPITSMIQDFGDFPLVGCDLIVDGVPLGLAPRRSVLDALLVGAAVEAGAELREGFTVEEFTTDGDRITGIRGRETRGGIRVSEGARVTVGADGRNSRLAQAVGAPLERATPPLTCWYFSYWSGVGQRDMGIHLRGDLGFFVFPTNDDLLGIFIAWPAAALPRVRARIEEEFMEAVERVPELAERVRSGRREERFYGASDVPNFIRKPQGPGWALVGDAGCHKDPYLALGMCDAFRDAELLAEALEEGLSGRRSLEAAMARYEVRRNEATLPDYEENLRLARSEPLPPEVLALRAALRGNQHATNQFLMARQGMIPRESFFNPENLQQVMAAGG
jgi:2-polyprenyl-6-methoxyphenol hydroxylase-like FAD-dependent oxidoreductase